MRTTIMIAALLVVAGCSSGTDSVSEPPVPQPVAETTPSPDTTPTVTPEASPESTETVTTPESTATVESAAEFILSSPSIGDDGVLPAEYTCDGSAISPPLQWSGAPEGTAGYSIVMHHDPGAGEAAHWYWVLYNMEPTTDHLDTGAVPDATVGTNSVNDVNAYAPPCSRGPGEKTYTITVFALSAQPDLPDPGQASRDSLLSAIDGLVLAQAQLDVTYERTEEN